MGGRGLIVVAIALILGILILKNGFSSSATPGGTTAPKNSTTTTAPAQSTTTAPAATTTVDRSKFTVLVANASGVSGAAGRLTDKMKSDGYVMAPATDATTKADQTVVYYVNGYQAQAADVAAYLNVGPPQAMPSPPPVKDLGQAQVLVVEGRDIASSAGTPASSTTAKAASTTAKSTSTTAAHATTTTAHTTTTVHATTTSHA
jgi:hypothetical protein